MGFLDFIFALGSGALGAVLLVVLVRALIAPLLGKIGFHRRGGVTTKINRRIRKADALIEEDKYEAALKELEKAFIIKVPIDHGAIQTAREHNQTILSRCLIVAEHLGGRADNLPEVERLLLERAEIQILRVKIKDSFQNIASRRVNAGKDVPSWSKTDFKRRIEEVKGELKRNQSELQSELQKFFSAIRTPAAQEDITYH